VNMNLSGCPFISLVRQFVFLSSVKWAMTICRTANVVSSICTLNQNLTRQQSYR
jgi:hypothetical protein